MIPDYRFVLCNRNMVPSKPSMRNRPSLSGLRTHRMVRDDDDPCATVSTLVISGNETPGVDDHEPTPTAEGIADARDGAVGGHRSPGPGRVAQPISWRCFWGASRASISRLGQAFEHRLDAQARPGLRCCFETIQSW